MRIEQNTVLITGGTSGIGFELAKQLLALGNKVIITGRDQARLDAALKGLPGAVGYRSDVSDPAAIIALAELVKREHPGLNVLVNNAGIMRKIDLQKPAQGLDSELNVLLHGPILMVQAFLPQLKSQSAAAILNVSSGLAFVPFPISPVYSAAKAGLHAYTQSLRVQLRATAVKVFELAPPLTETPLLGGFDPKDMEGVPAMPVAVLAKAAIDGLAKDRFEIRPGQANGLKFMSRLAPDFILKQLSKGVEATLARQGAQ